ncbi:MAG TPA: hypothetical protein VK625_14380, partial [Flavitalea sp.]|nr:hypothetical protein [Flavitalea sp.]
AGGIAAAVAGMIVVQKDKFSPLEHYNTLGYIIVVITIVGVFLVYRVSALVKRKAAGGSFQVTQPAFSVEADL